MPIEEYKSLNVVVRYLGNGIEKYYDTCAFNKETVFRGLPEEYIISIITAATEHLQTISPPSGRIIFDSSAYCEVGSFCH